MYSKPSEPIPPEVIKRPVAEDFTFTATALNPGIVKFTWEAPKYMDPKTEQIMLLYSVAPEPVFPGSFWYRRAGTDKEAVWGNITPGKRYFRACEYKDEKCVKYSNIVEVEVQ
jgi:hypothetical protein